jgi:hypothetical protein
MNEYAASITISSYATFCHLNSIFLLATRVNSFCRHSPTTQVHLLNLRFKQQQVIIWQGRGGVQV